MTRKIKNKDMQPINGSYTTAEIARMLSVSRPTAVAFLKDADFQVFEVNGSYRVKKVDFERWLEGTEEA